MSYFPFWDSEFLYFMKLLISYQSAKFQVHQLSESNFQSFLYDVTSQNLIFKIAHFVGLNKNYQIDKFSFV